METGFKKWIIVVTVVLCVLLELIDTSIVNVALNHMMGNLSATQQEVSWVVASLRHCQRDCDSDDRLSG